MSKETVMIGTWPTPEKWKHVRRRIGVADLINGEFTKEKLTKIVSIFGIQKIGLIVTCRDRLRKKFGSDDYSTEIEPRLIALALEQRAVILDVCTDNYKEVDKKIKQMQSLMKIVVSAMTKYAATPAASARRLLFRFVTHIQIIGGHDVVPFAVLPNAVDADTLYTDDVYADFTGDDVIDVPIARIPDGGSLDLLIKQLDGKCVPKAGAFGLGNAKREYAGPIMDIFDDAGDVYWSLPMTNDDFSVGDVDVNYVYFILHGLDTDTSIWWGEEPIYPEAFKANLANSQGVILSGSCYGAYVIGKTPADSICLRFLRSGAKAFVGCTGTHYSTPGTETTYNGPLFHRLFFEHLMSGKKPSEAFFRAKRDYAPEADTSVEEKILHEFVFYGRL